ncbi:hypothetical protein [Methylobacterium sp. Leaf118]|uniref:hypothetical protein n=1 Tax=Methylobacterium sp. Leaf118 TaxID=2876562 RepID=UPI001E471EBD|nr:hypothetical protein [Methylobacterium sp. Leaf118]
MRVLRLFILALAMIGGLAGLNATARAAPLPVAPMAGQTAEAPLVAKAYWYGYRRHYWRPRYYHRPVYYRRPYWRPRYIYRRPYWRPRPYYGRHYWRPRPYWHRRHYYRRFY